MSAAESSSHSAQCKCIFKHDKKPRYLEHMAANLSLIGKGTYGAVYKAMDTQDSSYLALKMIKMEKETQGFPVTAIREIKFLKMMKHENIVSLRDVVTYGASDDNSELKKEGFVRGDVFMVLDYVDNDLAGLLENPSVQLSVDHVRSYIKQILSGVSYMHKGSILNRDIKPANILITKDNQVKIADWGLARSYNALDRSHKYTNPVVTLWYRAPELLLGLREYGFAIDMWSVGCVFAELLFKTAVFKGKDESDQLGLIYQTLGTPNNDVLDVYKTYPLFNEIKVAETYARDLKSKFNSPLFDENALELLEGMLQYDPSKRFSAETACDATYFFRPDPVKMHNQLMKFTTSSHEFTVKESAKKRMREVEAVAKGDKRPTLTSSRPPTKPGGTASSKYSVKSQQK